MGYPLKADAKIQRFFEMAIPFRDFLSTELSTKRNGDYCSPRSQQPKNNHAFPPFFGVLCFCMRHPLLGCGGVWLCVCSFWGYGAY